MDSRCNSTGRTLFLVYYRDIYHWSWRYLRVFMCIDLLGSHISCRSLCTKSRWSKIIMYTVLGRWYCIHSIYVDIRKSKDGKYDDKLVPVDLCRGIFLRNCIYFADPWTEEC